MALQSPNKESQSYESQIRRRKIRFSTKSKTYKKLSQKFSYVPRIFNPLLKFDSPSSSHDKVRQLLFETIHKRNI